MASRRKEQGIEIKDVRRNKKFTVVLTNYCAEQYLEESLLSIFNQDYNNIEIIITDDGSPNFRKKDVDKIIEVNKSTNIKDIKFVINKENLGTVKTLNEALELVSGDYILFFASDDKLANNSVLSNYVKIFNSNKNVNVVTSNWIICDAQMHPIRKYQKSRVLKHYNKKKVIRTFEKLCTANIYGAGATCYRKCIFEKHGKFDESYRLLEDWPFWLRLAKSNERIFYSDFDGLCHRHGGVSSSNDSSNTKAIFCSEILKLYEDEILKKDDKLNNKASMLALDSYVRNIKDYSCYIDTKQFYDYAIDYSKNNRIRRLIHSARPHYLLKLNILIDGNKVVPISFVFEIILLFAIINFTNIADNKTIFLLFIVGSYIILYYFICTFMAFKRKRMSK